MSRNLHIGPGRKEHLPGFETLDIHAGPNIDHVADARSLPFPDQTFDLIYASHIIEHVPWYDTIKLLQEWHRVLTPNGALEVWTVNAVKVARLLIEQEDGTPWFNPDGWKRRNKKDNPYLWCAGRIFAYERTGNPAMWHKALFTPKHLIACFKEAGFKSVGRIEKPRGKDHGFVNLGVGGFKT